MAELLLWWVVIEAMGLLGLPLTFRLFSARLDHGYAFAKIITLLLVSYLGWVIGHLGILSYSASLNLAIALFIAASAVLLVTARAEIGAWLSKGGLQSILVHDLLWTLGFVFFAWQRSLAPEIIGAEKYMDFAFYNTLGRTEVMPPQDPWMSGETFQYYYFGYQMFANLGRLVPLPTPLSYNFCVVTLAALAFSQTTAIVLALTRSLAFGMLGGAMMTLIGNLDGFLQTWERGTLMGMDYWRSTRIVGGDSTINEFPYFTIIHGDMHPHFIVLPVALLLWGLLTDPERGRPAPGTLSRWGDLGFYAPIAFALGSSIVISPWELPVAAMMTFLLLQRDCPWWPIISWARLRVGLIVGAMLVIGYLMYLPAYSHLPSSGSGVGLKLATTSLAEFLTVFGAVMAAPALFLAHQLTFTTRLNKEVLQALLALAALVTVVALIAGNAVLVLLVALVGAALAGGYGRDDIEQRTVSLLILAGVIALLACEIVFIRDSYGERLYRMNTVFKLYFQAWILLVLAAPWCWRQLMRQGGAERGVALAVVGALLLASCAYPAGLTMTRLAHRRSPPTLDGNAYLQREHPGDHAAIEWLRANAEGMPVVLEASGDPYSYYARFSSNVGVPTVLGWANHEGLWRSHDSSVGVRRNDVARIYSAGTLEEVAPLLDRYQVKYVVVGELERKDHPAEGLAKFASLPVAFESGTTTIYRR